MLNTWMQKMKIQTVVALSLGLSISPLVNAYNHFPLSPSWFKNVYENISENRDTVWRGEIMEILNPTQLIIANTKGEKITVTLRHLTLKKGADSADISYSMSALEAMIGKQIYVLGDRKSEKVTAKIIDVVGNDINLNLVESGVFDINTTSLHFKYEKQQYLNALSNAKTAKIGIWN